MRTSVSSATSVRISMKMLLVGAVGMLALQALLVGGLLQAAGHRIGLNPHRLRYYDAIKEIA
jgi:hypothetical protein